MKQSTFYILCSLISGTCAAKILGIFSYCGYSHFILSSKLMKELSAKGHDVTFVTPLYSKISSKGYNIVPVPSLENFCEETNFYDLHSLGIALKFPCNDMGFYLTEQTFTDINKFINSNTTFDLVICEIFVNYAQMALADHFKASLILFSAFAPNEWSSSFLRHPVHPAYMPSLFSGYGYEMTTSQRMYNLISYVFNDVYDYFVVIPKHDEFIKKYLPNSPKITELKSKIDLILLNSHVSTNVVIPKLPNMIEIGGFHVEKEKLLPDDVKKFLDESIDGAIYFSVGTHVKFNQLGQEIDKAFLEAFVELNVRVLWKAEINNMDDRPNNVKIEKWLPQQDILAHPNVKLFISHCGQLSTIEAVYFGKPILGIPIFADQPTQCSVLKSRGMALTLKLKDITKNSLIKTIKELLHNPEYANHAKSLSKLLKDQDMKPLDKAIFWIEYVLRHKTAKHLQIHGMDMEWYQYYMIDLLLISFLVVVFTIIPCYITVKKCSACFINYRGKMK